MLFLLKAASSWIGIVIPSNLVPVLTTVPVVEQ